MVQYRRQLDTDQLIEVFPVVLRHQPERTQHRPAEVVKVGEAVVGVVACLATHVAVWARLRIISVVS